MKKIFRKELFVQDVENVTVDKELIQSALNTWVAECDGKEVVNNSITFTDSCGEHSYAIHDDWCEIVEE